MYDALCPKCDNRSHFFLLFFLYIYIILLPKRVLSCFFLWKGDFSFFWKIKSTKHTLTLFLTLRRTDRLTVSIELPKSYSLNTKILLFLLLIISLTQHNHLYLHFDTRSQNNKTQATMSDFVFFFLRERHSLFSLFINRIWFNPNNNNKICFDLKLYINTSIRVRKFEIFFSITFSISIRSTIIN